MYLKTPKRYTSGGRRRGIISLRSILLLVITPLAVLGGMYIYENQAQFVPPVSTAVFDLMNRAESGVSTARAPQPTPTQNPASNINRANDAWMRGSVEDAVELYDEVISAVPNDLRVHYLYTLGLIMLDETNKLGEAAENTVTANPFDPNAWTIRAQAFISTGDYGEAIASALRALEIASSTAVDTNPEIMAPARARAFATLAEVYFELEQYDRALTAVNQALDVYPDSPEAYYVRGLINWFSLAIFDREAAMEDFQIAYDIQPSYHYIAVSMVFLNSELGGVALRDGETAQSEAYYNEALALSEQILELNPGYPRILQFLADYYFRIVGDDNQASDYASRCVRSNPTIDGCYYLLGRAQMRLENYSDARSSFDSAIQNVVTPNGDTPYYYWWAARSVILLDPGDCSTVLNYLRPGWDIALEQENGTLLSDYSDSFQDCGASVGLTPTPLPALESTPNPDA
ncbi:MAG: tetratricopeptide repeat protein [Aggregatilineales bacterium]